MHRAVTLSLSKRASRLLGALCVTAASSLTTTQATAQDPGLSGLVGDWTGTYVCGQGLTRMTLRIESAGAEVFALYAFYAHEDNPDVPSGCYETIGRLDAETGLLRFNAGAWRLQPGGYITVDLEGAPDLAAGVFTGEIYSPNSTCTWFDLVRSEPQPIVDDLCFAPGPVSNAVTAQFR